MTEKEMQNAKSRLYLFFCTEIKRYKRLCLGTGRKSYGEKKKININCGRKKNNPKNGRERKRKQ